jgi:integrase/recombinase XerD
MKRTDLAHLLTAFLKEYLPSHRNLSPNTILAYRDAFTLLLRYCRDVRGLDPNRLELEHLNSSLIVDFLRYLEEERRCKAASRNQRLAALHSFFRYVQIERPQYMLQCQRILAIPHKRCEHPQIGYLNPGELAAILAQPDLSVQQGRRDAVLLSLLYDTGARVQELIDMSIRDVRLDAPAQVRLTGKGRKIRCVPLMAGTVDLLRDYLQEHDLAHPKHAAEPLFRNRQGERLSRSGIRYILQKYINQARANRTALRERISPHTLRHTKAMHLLQAGNPLVVISSILGHAQVQSTELYARADMQMKQKALQTVAGLSSPPSIPSWQNNPGLLERLRNL